jgi:hypothetical protein
MLNIIKIYYTRHNITTYFILSPFLAQKLKNACGGKITTGLREITDG